MDWKKILKAALIPAIALVVLQVIDSFIWVFLVGRLILFVMELGLFAMFFLVLLHAGYSAVRHAKLDLLGAALVGAVAGSIARIIGSIIVMLISIMFAGATVGGTTLVTFTPDYSMPGVLILSAAGLVIWAVIEFVVGAVLGLLGGLIAQIIEPKKKPKTKKPKRS
jgi:hypothetical protein